MAAIVELMTFTVAAGNALKIERGVSIRLSRETLSGCLVISLGSRLNHDTHAGIAGA